MTDNQMTGKTVLESVTSHVEIIMPRHTNGSDRLFGGQLMAWIDIVAAVVARRHSGCEVTTAAVDHLTFEAPAFLNTTVLLEGRMTRAGRTSMEVRVDTFSESLDGKRARINRAYLLLVAIDSQNRPTAVPPLILQTDEDREEWENALKRKAAWKK